MKSIHKLLAVALLAGLGAGSVPMAAYAAPELTMQQEREAHPRLVEAIRHMQEAVRELEAAPDDFGGNKGNAIADARRAIHSMKKALYWRLRMDDAAIERAE
jgi:GDP-D-mannose dehydratase